MATWWVTGVDRPTEASSEITRVRARRDDRSDESDFTLGELRATLAAGHVVCVRVGAYAAVHLTLWPDSERGPYVRSANDAEGIDHLMRLPPCG